MKFFKKPNWYRTIRYWFYCNWNKEHWRLVKQAFLSYGWDYYFLTELEERQIDKALRWFSKHKRLESWEQTYRSLKWAKHCLHVINTEGSDYFHFTGKVEFIPVIKDYYGNSIKSPNNKKAELYEMDWSNHKYHYDGPYINTRNALRFINADNKEYYLKKLHELYVAKCKNLYYKIREYYSDIWYD